MPFLFDTNAISEVYRPRPNRQLLGWLRQLPREDQFTSTVVIAELYAAAFSIESSRKWFQRIDDLVRSRITILPFDLACAREAGEIQALLRSQGAPIGTADVQIAATARVHSLVLVTANHRHFSRVPGLSLEVFQPGDS
ncbi:MAG: PIN domain-containing protein [Acidobacteria bacterium]|nr:PIN domain-containing protein [Acidobacteriota bacterium]